MTCVDDDDVFLATKTQTLRKRLCFRCQEIIIIIIIIIINNNNISNDHNENRRGEESEGVCPLPEEKKEKSAPMLYNHIMQMM